MRWQLIAALALTMALAAAALGLLPAAGTATFHGRNGPIAFRSDAGNTVGHESHAIWRVAPNGTDAERITRGFDRGGFEVDYSPVFFPDGRRFAYGRQIADRNLEVVNQIYVKSASAPANALGSPVLLEAVDYRLLSLAVSPNGRQLAIAAEPPPLEGTQIFVVDVDGEEEMTQLTSGPAPARTPEFSPDGHSVVFARRHHGKGGLFTIDVDGTGLRQLTSNPGDGSPSYSPSGDRIVFNGHAGRHIRIFSIRADGSGRTQLTRGPFVDRGPVFSPDGRSIVFSRAGGRRNPDLYLMRANGSGAHLLYASHSPLASDFAPDWGPRPATRH